MIGFLNCILLLIHNYYYGMGGLCPPSIHPVMDLINIGLFGESEGG